MEAGHTPPVAVGMAHHTYGKGKFPQIAKGMSMLTMTPDERHRFVWSLFARRTLAEGVLLTLAGDDVRDGAVLSAHALCEAVGASRRTVALRIGGHAASQQQVTAARDRVLAEIAELDDIVEATLAKEKKDKPLSSKDAGPKADPRVVHLQNRLNSLGHHVQSDGVFGQITTEAVKDFQTKIGEKPTGDVDDKTAEALRNGGKPVVDEEEQQAKRDEALKAAQATKGQPATDGGSSQSGDQSGQQTGGGSSGGRGRTITVKLSEGKLSPKAKKRAEANARKRGTKAGAFDYINAARPKGKRDHAIRETWSDEARAAARLARREDERGNQTEASKQRIRSIIAQYEGNDSMHAMPWQSEGKADVLDKLATHSYEGRNLAIDYDETHPPMMSQGEDQEPRAMFGLYQQSRKAFADKYGANHPLLKKLEEALLESVSAKSRQAAQDSGDTMEGGKYPIRNQNEADKAWNLRNNGTASVDAVTAHIRKQVKKHGLKMPGSDVQEAESTGDFPQMQMPSACPKCGAPMRKSGVCQRGHHIAKLPEA